MNERYIATVDLGTSSIALSVAKISGASIQVLYYDETPSDGVRYSGVFNPVKAALAIRSAVSKANSELGIEIQQVVTGLPRSLVRQEVIPAELVRDEDSDECITQEDIDTITNIALDGYPLSDPEHEEIYAALAQSFSTDESIRVPISDIVGVPSKKLDCNFKMFIGSRQAVKNIENAFGRASLDIAAKYFVPETTAQAVLSSSEMENGVGLIEIGAGVSSLSIFQGGILRYYGAIPFGGKSITNDIKFESGFPFNLCENIKLAYGACQPDKLQSLSEKILKVYNDDDGTDQDLSVKYLSEIITCRTREILEAILYMLHISGFESKLRNGLVLTGGGANMTNLCAYLKELSGYNVRQGFPKTKKLSLEGCTGILEASAAATVGLLFKAKEDESIDCLKAAPMRPKVAAPCASGAMSPASAKTMGDAASGDIAPEASNSPAKIWGDAAHSTPGASGAISPASAKSWGDAAAGDMAPEASGTPEVPVKKKPKVIWKDKVRSVLMDAFNGTLGSSYDNVE